MAEVEAYEVRAVEASYSKMLGKIFTVKQDRYIFFVRTGDLRIMCERNHGNSRVTGGKKKIFFTAKLTTYVPRKTFNGFWLQKTVL